MTVKRALTHILLLLSLAALSSACVVQDAELGEPAHETVTQEVRPPQACTAIAIYCLDGLVAKDLPNCQQTCVPDHGPECSVDEDCQIYCLVGPCDIGFCAGGSCQLRPGH